MKIESLILEAVCGWCSKGCDCIPVELDNGTKLDLCKKCFWSKLKAESKSKHNGKKETGTVAAA